MRGGSKGVSGKNLRLLNGKPLMEYTIEQAIRTCLSNHIIVSTDSSDIADVAKESGADAWFLRPKELATDDAPKIPVIRHAMLESEKKYDQLFDVVIDLDVTSPLRTVDDIINAFKQFSDENADNLISASPCRKNPYFNMVEVSNGRIQRVKELRNPPVRRQDAPEVYDMNASIYIWKRKILATNNSIFNEHTSLFIMPEERSVDIDTQLDWDFVEYITKNKTIK